MKQKPLKPSEQSRIIKDQLRRMMIEKEKEDKINKKISKKKRK